MLGRVPHIACRGPNLGGSCLKATCVQTRPSCAILDPSSPEVGHKEANGPTSAQVMPELGQVGQLPCSSTTKSRPDLQDLHIIWVRVVFVAKRIEFLKLFGPSLVHPAMGTGSWWSLFQCESIAS